MKGSHAYNSVDCKVDENRSCMLDYATCYSSFWQTCYKSLLYRVAILSSSREMSTSGEDVLISEAVNTYVSFLQCWDGSSK